MNKGLFHFCYLLLIHPSLEGDFGQQLQHREVQKSMTLKANETLEVHGMKSFKCKALIGKEITNRGLKARATTSKCPALNERVTTPSRWHSTQQIITTRAQNSVQKLLLRCMLLSATSNYYKSKSISYQCTAFSGKLTTRKRTALNAERITSAWH